MLEKLLFTLKLVLKLVQVCLTEELNTGVRCSGAIPLSALKVVTNSRLFRIDCIFVHLSIWRISEETSSTVQGMNSSSEGSPTV